MATDLDGVATAEPAQPSTRRERVGWYFYDWANSAFSTTVVAVFLGPYLTGIAESASGCETDEACRLATVNVFGFNLAVGSFYPTVIAIAVIINVLILPVVGAIADRSAHKRRLLGFTAFTGAGATTALIFVTEERYLLGGAAGHPGHDRVLGAASSSTTRSCPNWPPRTNATRSPASAGRSATSAAACCSRSTWSRSSCSRRRTAPARWPAGRSRRPACGGPCSRLIPLRWLKDRPPTHVVPARGGVLDRRLPAALGHHQAPARRSS